MAEEYTIEGVRQFMAEAFAGFVIDPPENDFQEGYLGALYVIAVEGLGMDPGPAVPDPPPRPKQVPYLRVVK